MRKALLLVALIISTAHLLRAQEKPRVDKVPACGTPDRKVALQGAKLTLAIDRTRYSLKDTMVVDAAIRNDGHNDIYVYSKFDFGLLAEFTDSAGTLVPRGELGHVPPPPEKDPKDYDNPSLFIKLSTGDFVGNRSRLLLKRFVHSPGRYTVRLGYMGTAVCELYSARIQALSTFWLHDPEIKSNAIAFEVTP